jgi:hypothetical protein
MESKESVVAVRRLVEFLLLGRIQFFALLKKPDADAESGQNMIFSCFCYFVSSGIGILICTVPY